MTHKVDFDRLDDVNMAGKADGDVPQWDTATSRYIPLTPVTNSLEVKEADGSPDVTGVTQIILTDGTLTDNGSGSVSIAIGTGGSGASTADHYIVGMGGEGDSDLSAKVIIPGLSGSPDIRVAGTNDDEFDQNTSGTPSGWTNISSGTADTINTTAYKSHLYMKANAGAGTAWKGIYKTAPGTPFAMTAKITDCTSISNYNYEAIAIGEAGSTGKFTLCGIQRNGNGVFTADVTDYTNRTTVATAVLSGAQFQAIPPIYFRIVATSSSSVSYWLSYGGQSWYPLVAARNPGFTIGIVALMVNAESASDAAEMYVDWVRFT